MLDVGKKSRQYFVPPNSFSPNWRLKSDEEYSLETGTRPKESRFVIYILNVVVDRPYETKMLSLKLLYFLHYTFFANVL